MEFELFFWKTKPRIGFLVPFTCGIKTILFLESKLEVLHKSKELVKIGFYLISASPQYLIFGSLQMFITFNIYIWKRLFVCFICHLEIYWTTTLLVTFLVLLRNPQWGWMHEVSFIMFWPTMQKLFNIEQFFHWKIIEIK